MSLTAQALDTQRRRIAARLSPCADIAQAVRGVAQIVVTSADPDQARAKAIKAFIESLDIELRSIAMRDVAADARKAGL